MALKFGLVGTGYWATHTQGAGLAAHPGVEFAGAWGRDPAKAAALADACGTTAYRDVDALFADVDAVAFSVPPDVQADLAVRAAEAGCHLLLDKPLALTTAAADRVVNAVAERGVASVVFFTNRFYPNIEEFLHATAATGDWHGARVTQFASIFQPGNPYGASPWRRERGALWDIGPHALSVLWPVLGPVAEVTAVGGPRATTHLTLRHTSGAVSTLSLTLDAPPEAGIRDTTFYGEHGVATMPSGDGTAQDAFTAALGQFLDNVAAGTTRHPCDVSFGRDVVAVLEAAEAARREARTVPLP
ncbi:Gfo/Idh/MocA family oxidoreductase [Actinomycetes bacterium KLBMP 9797]